MRKRTDPSDRPAAPFEPHVAGIAYEILDELGIHALRRAQLGMLEVFTAVAGATRFTPQRFSSLVLIEQNPGLTQTRLGEILGIARSGVMLLVDFHEAEGFVERKPAGADRRAYGLRITPLGRRRLAELKRLVREADRSALAALSAAERRQLFALLARVGRAPAQPRQSRA
jgi:DNA-binding MarR family transcriptional regulator